MNTYRIWAVDVLSFHEMYLDVKATSLKNAIKKALNEENNLVFVRGEEIG